MLWGDHITETQIQHLFWLLLFSFIWAKVAIMVLFGGRVGGEKSGVYNVWIKNIPGYFKPHKTKEEQQNTTRNVSLKNKTEILHFEIFPPVNVSWAGKISQEISVLQPIYVQTTRMCFLDWKRGKTKISFSPGCQEHNGTAIVHLVAFLSSPLGTHLRSLPPRVLFG